MHGLYIAIAAVLLVPFVVLSGAAVRHWYVYSFRWGPAFRFRRRVLRQMEAERNLRRVGLHVDSK